MLFVVVVSDLTLLDELFLQLEPLTHHVVDLGREVRLGRCHTIGQLL